MTTGFCRRWPLAASGSAAWVAGAALMAAALPSQAESSFQTATSGTITASARLDFSVTIPRILFLQVGTGATHINNTTVDLVAFNIGAVNLGNGQPVAAANSVMARVVSSAGAVNLSATTGGALLGPAGQTLSYSQITASAGVLTSASALPHPTLSDNASNTVNVTATNGAVNRDATWTFSFSNTVVVGAGTYGGVNTSNGRVTYTATTP